MSGRRATAVCALIIAIAAVVRIAGLTTRGVGHIEMYAPNIPLPAGISDPPPRLTILKTLTGSLWEVHPPAWYLLNYPWTRIAGTSPRALRLPSAIFGVISLWLLWALARRERTAGTALVATALLAFSGLHVMWSQISRPVMMASLLALASSLLLLRLTEEPRRRSLLWWYLAASLLGLATEYYYWPVFGGQVAWVLLVGARDRQLAERLIRWQMLALIVTSPLITVAISQSRPSYLGADTLDTAFRYVGFGFLLGPVESTPAASNWLSASAMGIGLVLFAVLVIRKPVSASAPSGDSGLPSAPAWLTAVITLAATLAAAGSAMVLSANGMGSLAKLLTTAAAPVVLVVIGTMLTGLIQRGYLRRAPAVPLTAVLAILPPAAAFGVSLIVPFIDVKYFLLFTPFLSIVLAEGLIRVLLAVHGPVRWMAAGLIGVWLVFAHASSLRFFGGIDATPIDYRSLAAQLQPLLRDTDRILVFKHYAMTPLFYHVPDRPGRYVGDNYAAAVRTAPDGRVWVISLRDSQIDDPDALRQAVAGCHLSATLTARRIRAELYEGCSGPGRVD